MHSNNRLPTLHREDRTHSHRHTETLVSLPRALRCRILL